MLGWKAFWLLAFHFWKHVFKKVTFMYDRGGEKRFVENYEPDRILPLPEDARAKLPQWQGCTACGICDAVYPADTSLMGLVVSGIRDFSAQPALSAEAAKFNDEDKLIAAERACPNAVPIREVVAHISRADERLKTALATTR